MFLVNILHHNPLKSIIIYFSLFLIPSQLLYVQMRKTLFVASVAISRLFITLTVESTATYAFWPKIRHQHVIDIFSLYYNTIRVCVRVCIGNAQNVSHSHFLLLYERLYVVDRMFFVDSENEELSRHGSCTQWTLFSRTPHNFCPWACTSISRSRLHVLLLSLLLWSLRFIAPLSSSYVPHAKISQTLIISPNFVQ